ncbi:MAG: D-2-hydroxyacid dehydrogenase [Opitutus sp.]
MSAGSIFVYAHLDVDARALLDDALRGVPVTFFDKTKQPTAEEQAQFRQSIICFGNVPANWLSSDLPLRWLQLESIGFEYYQRATALPPQLTITNLKGLFDRPTAETTIAGLLALYRGVDQLVQAQATRQWVSLKVRPQTEILGAKRVVILGAGSIGRKIRTLLEAFGCCVQSFARTSPHAELQTLEALEPALATCDIAICCLPNTMETRGLFNARRIGLLPRSAVFVNVGRGAVVDEAALIDALQQRRLSGAVIDVTLQEPLPPTHALWTCPRTLLLQHTGGGYGEELSDKARVFLRNLAHFQSGEPLENVIDLSRGY